MRSIGRRWRRSAARSRASLGTIPCARRRTGGPRRTCGTATAASGSERRVLHLASRAVEARPPDDHARADRPCAAPARLAGAVVDPMAELEPARAAEAVAVVGDRRAAASDRLVEHGAGRAHQARALLTPQA